MTDTLAPVTAAVDPTKMGGFDQAGKWHDPYGRFARRGASAVKVALLRILDGDRAKHAVLSAGPDGANLQLSPNHPHVGVLGRGPHHVHYHDARYGRFDGPDSKPVLVRWDQFDEAGLPDPPRSEQAPPAPSAPSHDESERRRRLWTGVIGDMTRYAASEDDERGDRARTVALATVSAADLARIADALESLSPEAQQAFGVRSTESMFPDGKLPDGVDFWFDYGAGFMAEAPPPTRIEDTRTYATYKPILDGWRSNPEMFSKRHPDDFDPTRPISRDNEPFGSFVDDAEAEMADARRRHDNIPEDRKVRTPEQAKIAAAREFVGSLFSGWAESSLSYRSVIFQRAVADAFGLHYEPYASDAVKGDAGAIYDAAPEAWQGYVRSLYDQTQQALAAAGITEATVFRGADRPADAPLSSWSVSPNIASVFGDEIRRADVPAADIFATPLLTGIGKSEEGEVVLLNRPRRQWTIHRPGDPRDHGTPDGRMFDMWFDYDQEDVQSPRPGWEPGADNDLIDTPPAADAPVAPPAPTWPSERLVGDLSFVDDTTIPWADRVARLAAERDALVERLGPNAHRWFTSPLPDTLDRVWNNPDGLYREERQSLDRVQAITAFGTALATLVAEKADDLTGGEPLRLYTPDASRAIIDAIEEFAPRSTIGPLAPNPTSNGGTVGTWSGRDPALEAWPLLVDGIRNGTTDFVVKKNEVILIGSDANGTLVRATIAKRDYGGDWGGGYTERLPSGRNVYRNDSYGHIDVEVLSERQSYMNPSAWTRGAGTFDALHKATKDALATSAKATFADLSNPPTLRAWTATMEAMGVDMSTNPDLPVSTGAVQEHEVTVMAWGQAVQVPRSNWDAIQNGERTPLGKLKASSAAAKTIHAGLSPYPRWWTDMLPPQHLHMPNSTRAKGGSAGNTTLPDGSNYIETPSIVGHPQHASSAAHEFGHSMQKVIPAVHRAEAWSLIDRLAQHPGENPDDVSRGRGIGHRDHFAEDYSGRFYLHPDAPDDLSGGKAIPAVRTFEMFTTGVQTLFDTPGTRRAKRGFGTDPELSGLTLGLMALVPQPQERPAAPEVGAGNDLPSIDSPAPRSGSAKAHAYLDAVEAEFGDPVAAEPGYEMQTPWRASEGRDVSGSYDIDRFMEMSQRYSGPDVPESDKKFVTAVRAGMIELFEDMERAGVPSPRSPETRAAMRRVADALPEGVELQYGSQFYGTAGRIGVPVEGIEGFADAFDRFAHVTPDLHLDTVKVTEASPAFGSNGAAYMFPRKDASSLVLATGMYRTVGGDSAKPWGQENYQATTQRELADHFMTHEIGHAIQMELVRRSNANLEPDKNRPTKVLDAMIDDAMARLDAIAADNPDLFQAAAGQPPGDYSAHAYTASGLTDYSGTDAAEYLAEAFAIAVFGTYPQRPVTRATPIEWPARVALSHMAAVGMWRDLFGDSPLPGAMSDGFPDDWDHQRVAAAILGGIIPPGWGRARIEALAANEDTPPTVRAALEALAAKMEPT